MTLRLGWPPDQQPGDIVAVSARRYGLKPMLVHSTSWRLDKGRLVLTYIVAVRPPVALNENLVDEAVARADLARGDALTPPPEIGVVQVLEHAFRHLAWLVNDDDTVRAAIRIGSRSSTPTRPNRSERSVHRADPHTGEPWIEGGISHVTRYAGLITENIRQRDDRRAMSVAAARVPHTARSIALSGTEPGWGAATPAAEARASAPSPEAGSADVP